MGGGVGGGVLLSVVGVLGMQRSQSYQRPYIRRRCTPIQCLCDAYLGTLIPAPRWSCSRSTADSNDC